MLTPTLSTKYSTTLLRLLYKQKLYVRQGFVIEYYHWLPIPPCHLMSKLLVSFCIQAKTKLLDGAPIHHIPIQIETQLTYMRGDASQCCFRFFHFALHSIFFNVKQIKTQISVNNLIVISLHQNCNQLNVLDHALFQFYIKKQMKTLITIL